MSIDYSNEPTTPLCLTESFSFRSLPVVTKGFAAYLRTLVEPVHGCIRVRKDHLLADVRDRTMGPLGRGDFRLIARALKELQEEGHVRRCRILDESLGQFPRTTGPAVPLSGWIEDPDGEWLVITDWIPSTHRFTAEETDAWHQLRRERARATLAVAARRDAETTTSTEKPQAS